MVKQNKPFFAIRLQSTFFLQAVRLLVLLAHECTECRILLCAAVSGDVERNKWTANC